MDKKTFKTDIAVLILFFNRPEPLRQVFAEVKKARPSHLFLYQDGPRDEHDMAGIEECREVVDDEQIDWECDVRRNYQTENAGCDPSNYNAQKWAFSLSDKVVVFEDDSIPSVSFIRFCKEMLDRYEHDERITLVSGFNSDEITQGVPYDYFFTSVFSIWGWASWRRVIDQWDASYSFLDDEYNWHQLTALAKERKVRKSLVQMPFHHRESGKAYYESIFWPTMMFNSGLAITPTRNMINNLGAMAGDAVHYTASFKAMPKRLRQLFTMKRHELEFPLKHPKYVIENIDYKHHVYRTNGWGHPWIKIKYSLEELWNNLRQGNFKMIGRAISNRLKIFSGKRKFK